MRKWVIDTDGGVDDAQALILALSQGRRYGFETVAVTLVAGNVELPQVVKNAGECLRIAHRTDVPLYLGASRPMVATYRDAKYHHGSDGLRGYWDTADQRGLPSAQSESAVSAILRLSRSAPLSIVTLGPLTNLALAALIDPLLPQRVERLVVMGGAETGNGNITPTAEFNVYCDPEAAHIVFSRFPRIEAVSWECIINPANAIPASVIQEYRETDTKAGRFLKFCTEKMRFVSLCDPLAVAVAMDPGIVVSAKSGHCWVDLGNFYIEGKRTRGRTTFDQRGITQQNATFVEKVDIARFAEMMLESVRH